MDTLLYYLIRSLLVSGLMLGYYLAVLRNRKLHAFNRVWLLSSLLASVALPLIRVGWLTWHSAAPSSIVTFVAGTGAHPVAAKTIPVWIVVILAGGLVSAVLLAILLIRVLRVYRLKQGHRMQRLEGCTLIEIQDRRAPFSFGKNLFWQEGADLSDPVNRKILDHELAHIRGGHTYDILFAQTVAAVLWFNPFYWLIRRELQMVHEFIADGASVATGDTETFAQMLLRAYDDGRYLDPSHHFFHSPIKRRLRMINSSKPPSGLRKLLVLPVLLAVMVLACSKEQNAPAKDPLSHTLSADNLRLAKIIKDSVQVAFNFTLRKLLARGIDQANKSGEAHMTLDTLGIKARLDLGPGFKMDLKDRPSNLPPPANDEVILGAPEIKPDSNH
jgi:beta-lactamase regulating signal transducer with metallopeptidase domain